MHASFLGSQGSSRECQLSPQRPHYISDWTVEARSEKLTKQTENGSKSRYFDPKAFDPAHVNSFDFSDFSSDSSSEICWKKATS
ncbi:hypothetical protein BDV11DRAFT_181410 [Aspergillus similis]